MPRFPWLLLRDGWDTVALDRPPIASIETTISGPGAPGDLVKTDPTMADALFAIAMVINYAPGPDRPTKDVMGFAAKEPAGDGYRGNYAGVTVANSPYIAPIAFKGTFRMYRLGPEPQPSWWARALDIFTGCGRTKSWLRGAVRPQASAPTRRSSRVARDPEASG